MSEQAVVIPTLSGVMPPLGSKESSGPQQIKKEGLNYANAGKEGLKDLPQDNS